MSANGRSDSQQITIVGGGLAGLTAAIACAEGGAKVRLLEAHEQFGGRARSTDGPFKANLGPHALYQEARCGDGWRNASCSPRTSGRRLGSAPRISLERRGPAHAPARRDPLGAAPARSRGSQSSSTSAPGPRATPTSARPICSRRPPASTPSTTTPASSRRRSCGRRPCACSSPRPPGPARYSVGGWGALVTSLERRVRELGVSVETAARVDELPDGAGDRGHRARAGRTSCWATSR